jgi:hypothetical protein
MLTLNVTNRIIMKITVWLIPTRQRFDNCLLEKFNYSYEYLSNHHIELLISVYLTVYLSVLHCEKIIKEDGKIYGAHFCEQHFTYIISLTDETDSESDSSPEF